MNWDGWAWMGLEGERREAGSARLEHQPVFHRRSLVEGEETGAEELKSTEAHSPTSQFAWAGPGMGLIAHFSYPVPGNLPSLHICQGWAAPLRCRTHPREGRGRTSRLPLTTLLPRPRPCLRTIWPRSICWAVGCSEQLHSPLSVWMFNSPLGSANRLPKSQGFPIEAGGAGSSFPEWRI